MTFGAVDIRTHGVQYARRVLDDLESKLSAIMDRRDKIIIETARASAKASAIGGIGDQSARISLGPLNKQAASCDSEIALIRIEISHAKRRLELAEAHDASVRSKAAVPIAEGAERLFLVNTPHNLHQVRHKARTIESLRSRLLPGYTIEGEIFGANDAGEGGVVAAIEPTGPSIMMGLLLAHGAELLKFLEAHGLPVARDEKAA
jgi:hypothetical protein